jgi:hypothetical protein
MRALAVLYILAAVWLGGTAWAQTAAPPTSPYVTPGYGSDPAHPHQAYAATKYGISCPGDRVVDRRLSPGGGALVRADEGGRLRVREGGSGRGRSRD